MAVATAGERLQIPVEVYVPTTTMPIMVQRLRNKGAKVFVGGANWNDADAIAREALSSDQSARYIPPFDDPLIWEGHSSIVEELLAANEKPDAIVVSVGGGGLLAGVQRGLKAVGWTDVTVVAAETQGTASFRAAKEAGRVVRLAAISSVATSLGALAVTPATLETDIMTISEVVSDAEAVEAVCSFANDFRMLVEPACGAALSLAYSSHKLEGYKKPVVVVCGGGAVNLELIAKWREQLGI
jgi:L-serine/L-threonine ammonia-lyase